MAQQRQLRLTLLAAVLLACSQVAAAAGGARAGQAGWEPLMRASRDSPVCLQLPVEPRDEAGLAEAVDAVSDPASPRYGQFLTREQLAVYTAASDEQRQALEGWLSSGGDWQASWSRSGDFLKACGSMQWAEAVTAEQWWVWRHRDSGAVTLAPLNKPKLPPAVASAVRFCEQLHAFPPRSMIIDSWKAGRAQPDSPARRRFSLQAVGAAVDGDELARQLAAARNAAASSLLTRLSEDAVHSLHSQLAAAKQEAAAAAAAGDGSIHAPLLALFSGQFRQMVAAMVVFCPDGSMNTNQTWASVCNGVTPLDVTIAVRSALHSNDIGTVNVVVPFAELAAIDCVFEPQLDVTICPVFTRANLLLPVHGTPLQAELSLTFSAGSTNATFSPLAFDDLILPADVKALYNVPAGLTAPQAPTQAVIEYGGPDTGSSMSPTDLSIFQEYTGLPFASADIIGDNDETQPGGEPSLDIQVIMGVSPTTATQFVVNEVGLINWFSTMLDMDDADLPRVVSTSYSFGVENGSAIPFAQVVNSQAQKLGARGVSLLFSSGDSGSSNHGDGGGDVPLSVSCEMQLPSIPAATPYVTSVGGTQVSHFHRPICKQASNGLGLSLACDDSREMVCSTATGALITSGGGFSKVFKRPSYQAKAVASWTQQAAARDLFRMRATANTRGYPDVAALARNFMIIQKEQAELVDGTSAAAPAFAAIISLINDARVSHRLKPLGFLNPWLYSLPADAFNDIVEGDNACGRSGTACCPDGYSALPGWDPVTGRGSPNFARMMEYAVAAAKPVTVKPTKLHSGFTVLLAISGVLLGISIVALLLVRRNVIGLEVSTSNKYAMGPTS